MKYYDSIADGYDALHMEEQLSKLRIIRKYIAGQNRTKIKLLDVGCGTFFSYDFFDCEVYGVEPSENMVKQHPEHKALLKQKRLFVSPAETICNLFEENFFDVVICVTSAHHFQEPKRVFECIKKITKKDAMIIFSLLKSDSMELILKNLEETFHVLKKIDEGKDLIVFCT